MQTLALGVFLRNKNVIRPRRVRPPLRRWLLIEAVKLSILYMVLAPIVMPALYNRLAFFPDTSNYNADSPIEQIEKKFGVKKSDVYFPSANGKKLHGWLFRHPNSDKVVLFSHGNGGNIAHRLPVMLTLLTPGTSVLLYDYEGYGISEGQPDIVTIREDGLAAFDFLVKEGHYKPESIILYGESVGTGVSAHIASCRRPAGIILQSGYASLIAAGRDRLPWLWLYPDLLFPPDLNTLAIMKRPHAPLLLIHGDADAVLPVRYSQEIFAAAMEPKQLIVVNGKGHNDLPLPQVKPFNEGVCAFIAALCAHQ